MKRLTVKSWLLGITVIGLALVLTLSAEAAGWRARRSYQYRAGAAATGQAARGGTFNSQWNANNTWYNVPNNGNYAPPPYATSKRAFYQVGPVPAIGGVRSLSGWGGAR